MPFQKRSGFRGSWVALTVSLPLLVATVAQADDFLIRETESLRNSLTSSDPSRIPLTLRLADLYMDAASHAQGDKPRLQARALALYEEAVREKLAPQARLKIDFQRARLMSDLGQIDQSVELWKTLAQQREMPEVAREAALRLAESGDTLHAAQWFQVALDLCSGGDLCSYIRFKRAWLYRQAAQGGLADDRAISEMELALFDAKGQLREESLRDYVLFLGEKPASSGAGDASAREALAKIESLSQRLDRKSLIGELAEAYFAAGNKISGTVVLAQAQQVEPKFSRLARLTEEQYGLRDWNAFTASLDQLSSADTHPLMALGSESDRVEGEKILRRLVIQLDGERISQSQRTPDFQKASLAYLGLFPQSPEKPKFQEGWLASEKDAQLKLDRLASWIKDEPQSVRLREFRASIAQKAELHEVVAEEMGALAAIPAAQAKSREYRYLQARALYSAKKFAPALEKFTALAQVEIGATPDTWAIQSQNLSLDILAQQKNWDALIARAGDWLDSAWVKNAKDAALKKELADMDQIRNQARFERAVAMGDTAPALAQFIEFCRTGVFAEKSCENARILSLKIKDQESLISVLALMGESRKAELAQELEAAGYFARAATVQEQLATASKVKDATIALKVALLWELSGDDNGFARAVQSIQDSKVALNEQQEALWLSMALDLAEKRSGLISAKSLQFVKTEASRGRIAEHFEASGQSSNDTRKILLNAKVQTGKAWAKLVLGEVQNLIQSAQGISFYGKNSKSQFEKRLKALVQIAKRADEFFPKCDAATKSSLATMLQQAYVNLAQEIRESPIPEGVPQEAIAELKQGLDQMAKPFDEKAAVYAQVILPAAAPIVSDASAATSADSIVVSAAHAISAATPAQKIETALAQLHRDPESTVALETLKDTYRGMERLRLAGYFEGRLNSAGGRK